MNESIYHLVAFIAALAALTVLIVSGHGNDPMLQSLIAGIVGGSGITSLGKIGKDFFNTSDVTATNKQKGHARVWLIAALACIAIAGCALLKQPASSQTQTIETACATTAAAVESLAIVQQAHPLPAQDAQNVSHAIATLSGVCTAPKPQTYTDVELQAITQAAAVLSTEGAKYATGAGSQ